MAKRIKVGVITNRQGAHVAAYLDALAATEACAEVVLADPDGHWHERARGTLQGKLAGVHDDGPGMLRRESPVLTLVSLESRVAPPMIAAALEAGSHVMAEKPACVRLEDFEPLVFKAESRHLNLMLALANRLNPEFRRAQKLVREGRLGDIYGLDMHLVADQTRLTRESYQRTWFADSARSGGGHLAWLGIHWLDLAMELVKSDIVTVAGMITNVGGQPVKIEDSAVATLRFAGGFLGTMTSGYYLDRGYQSGIKVWGSRGWLHLQQMADRPLRWYESDGEQAGKIQEFTGSKQPRGYTPWVRAVVEACADGTTPPIEVRDSLRVLRTLHGIYRAAGTGRQVEL